MRAKAYVVPPMHLARGDAAAALAAAPHRFADSLSVGGQEQFYLEGQISYAIALEDDGMLVHCSTQHPSEMQQVIAHALGLSAHHVQVQCRRMGGGFGGKESQSALFACVAALAARRLGRPVKLRLDRDDDFMATGRRHGFEFDFDVGFDDDGRVLGVEIDLIANAGFSADLSPPVMTRAICHFDNAYWLPHVAMHGYCARTNTQSNTAFRGFGGPQGAIAIEFILDSIARRLGKDPLDVRRVNYYGTTDHNVTPYGQTVEDNIIEPLTERLLATSGYRERRREIAAWNATSPVLKRGLALTPVKFGISFNVAHFNQAGALVHIYADGSVLVNHGGTEMGQGLNTKVAQVVAHELAIDFDAVRVTATDTQKVANTSATAASTGADLNGKAAQDAARQIRERLAAFAAKRHGGRAEDVRFANGRVSVAGKELAFAELVRQAYMARVQLVERRLLRHARPALGSRETAGQAVLLLRLRRGGERGGGRHVDRRVPAAARRRAARRRHIAESGDRHRPGRRRVHPGHGLADDGRTRLASEDRRAADTRAEHLQDPDRQRLPAALRRAPVRAAEPGRQHPPQQGRRRAAAAAAVLGAAGDPRRGVCGRRPPCRSAAACASDAGGGARCDRRGAGGGAGLKTKPRSIDGAAASGAMSRVRPRHLAVRPAGHGAQLPVWPSKCRQQSARRGDRCGRSWAKISGVIYRRAK